MRALMRAPWLLALLLCWGKLGRAETAELCGIMIESTERLDLSSTEKSWLCGDPQVEGWGYVPPAQKEFFLRRFLQDRGYHQPSFRGQGAWLVAEAGSASRVRGLHVWGAPEGLDADRKRGLVGGLLSPSALTEAENWVKRVLQETGYPCPEAKAAGDIRTGLIEVRASPGRPARLGKIGLQGGIDLQPEILDRFTVFVEGQPFDVRLLELSSQRILKEDLYLSTYYDISCPSGGEVEIVRRFLPAPPRLLTIGAGFDTERGAVARAEFRRVRIGHAANSLEATLLATFRQQSIESRFHWHFSRDLGSSLRLIPLVSLERQSERHFEVNSTQLGLRLANDWETPGYRVSAELGPSLAHTTTIRGLGRKRVDAMKATLRLSAISHLFEYYASHPRSGWSLGLDLTSRVSGLLSDASAQRLAFRHEALWNLGGFDPPLLVLGWRGHWGTYLLSEAGAVPFEVPVSERFFLGGDDDIRGFGRKALPGNESGFLSAAYQGIELRAGEWGIYPVQPLVFFDVAKGGGRSLGLSDSLYYAPGAGFRYAFPFGSVRATVGRGYISNPKATDPEPGLEFFFSFGREF